MVQEQHPPHRRARMLRAVRALRRVRGWTRFCDAAAPRRLSGAFVVRNARGVFAGDIGSFIDRALYLDGGYEEELIDLFLGAIPFARRGVVLDVGANVGTHSVAFARAFAHVHAFEPYPPVRAALERNIGLNGLGNVTVHATGLASCAGERAFHLAEERNLGMGTFSTVEQYETPLRRVGAFALARGDDVLAAAGVSRVDAIKIDVQGYEGEALAGLAKTIARDRPYIWLEIGAASDAVARRGGLATLVGEGLTMQRMRISPHRLALRRAHLEAVQGDVLAEGNYLVTGAIDPRVNTATGP